MVKKALRKAKQQYGSDVKLVRGIIERKFPLSAQFYLLPKKSWHSHKLKKSIINLQILIKELRTGVVKGKFSFSPELEKRVKSISLGAYNLINKLSASHFLIENLNKKNIIDLLIKLSVTLSDLSTMILNSEDANIQALLKGIITNWNKIVVVAVKRTQEKVKVEGTGKKVNLPTIAGEEDDSGIIILRRVA